MIIIYKQYHNDQYHSKSLENNNFIRIFRWINDTIQLFFSAFDCVISNYHLPNVKSKINLDVRLGEYQTTCVKKKSCHNSNYTSHESRWVDRITKFYTSLFKIWFVQSEIYAIIICFCLYFEKDFNDGVLIHQNWS